MTRPVDTILPLKLLMRIRMRRRLTTRMKIIDILRRFILGDKIHGGSLGVIELGQTVGEGSLFLVLFQEGVSFAETIVLSQDTLEELPS